MCVCLDRRIVDEIGYKHTSSHLFRPLYAYPGREEVCLYVRMGV